MGDFEQELQYEFNGDTSEIEDGQPTTLKRQARRHESAGQGVVYTVLERADAGLDWCSGRSAYSR
eukprot:6431947-Pyramimonas_sp.AAC.2